MTNEVLDSCNKRWELREKKHSSGEARVQYQNVHRQVRKKNGIAKEEWIDEQCSTIEKGMETGDSKMPTVLSNPSPKPANWEQLS